ncbi:hypothetical protein C6990_08545 [Nitrosopumilus sp. b3]|uniref:hypothetical protein n=1 Tax=Nitrosopumilus sp. b3 TaxID=2109909 RepID=UPI0015F65549|nr:hypothetical protein [Nitrosopumilus sp. b3]KAF6246536.1 hypothetical protein C6990_08545 [Nitrosopumilus sp. b3]
MRNDERFEIQRAFDLLPHVVGSSWAVIWFRMKGIKKPTREEYRDKTLEFLKKIEPVFDSYPKDEEFSEIMKYIEYRKNEEYDKIKTGENKEVETRYDRYVDYG